MKRATKSEKNCSAKAAKAVAEKNCGKRCSKRAKATKKSSESDCN